MIINKTDCSKWGGKCEYAYFNGMCKNDCVEYSRGIMFDKDYALKLSGKLAIAANKVINSNVCDLSGNIKNLNGVLMEYDKYIFSYNKNESDNII